MEVKRVMQASVLYGFLFIIVGVAPALAQTKITRPIRMIVPYVPGGGTDTLGRLMAPHIGEAFGQQVVLDNRAGGSSTIGTHMISQAVPDGQTIGIVDAAFVTNPSLFGKLPYRTPEDFSLIGLVATAPMVLVVNTASPLKTVKDLVATAKAQPGKLTYGTAGAGSATHLAAEQLRSVAGIEFIHVPYKGSGQSITELMGGHLSFAFTTQGTARPHVMGGRLRALGITSPARTTIMPDVPTFTESGLAKVDTTTITGIIGPPRLPRDFVLKVNGVLTQAVKTTDMRERYVSMGYEATPLTPEAYAARVRDELAKWKKLIADAGIRVEGM
jgi:tripartite-type tricarboxylate transporter receptor subunit TctC